MLDERVGLAAELVLTTTEVRGVLGQLGGQDQMGDGAYITGVDVEEDETGIDIAVRVLPERSAELRVAEIKSDLLARFALRPEAQVRVKLDQASSRRVLVRVEDVPGLRLEGLATRAARATPSAASTEADGRGRARQLARDRRTLACGRHLLPSTGCRASTDSSTGATSATPTTTRPPSTTSSSTRPSDVVLVGRSNSGPVRAVAVVERTYRWPERIDEARRARAGEREVVVSSRVELRAGEQLVRVTTSFDNTCRDHRLRAWFPLPEPARPLACRVRLRRRRARPVR